MQFYNPKMSSLKVGVTLVKGNIQIEMARALNPQAQGRPQAGAKVFDWNNKNFFSLSPGECVGITRSFDRILQGTYEDPDPKAPQDLKNVFKVTHFRQNQPSRLFLAPGKDPQGNLNGCMLLTTLPPQSEGQNISFLLRGQELLLFKSYIENGARMLPFIHDCFEAVDRAKKYKENQQNQQGGQGGQQSGGGYGGYDQNYSGGGGQQNQPQQNSGGGGQQTPPQENVDNIDNQDFQW